MRLLEYARDSLDISVAPDLSGGLPSGSALPAGHWNYLLRQWDGPRLRQLARKSLGTWTKWNGAALTYGFESAGPNLIAFPRLVTSVYELRVAPISATGLGDEVGKAGSVSSSPAVGLMGDYPNMVSYRAESSTKAVLWTTRPWGVSGYSDTLSGFASQVTAFDPVYHRLINFKPAKHSSIKYLLVGVFGTESRIYGLSELDAAPKLIDAFPTSSGVLLNSPNLVVNPAAGIFFCPGSGTTTYVGSGSSKGSLRSAPEDLTGAEVSIQPVAGVYIISVRKGTSHSYYRSDVVSPTDWTPLATTPSNWTYDSTHRNRIHFTVDGVTWDTMALPSFPEAKIHKITAGRVWLRSESSTFSGVWDQLWYSDVMPDVDMAVV